MIKSREQNKIREDGTIKPDFDVTGFAIVWVSRDVYAVYSDFKLKEVNVLSDTVKQIKLFSNQKCSKSTKEYKNGAITTLTVLTTKGLSQ
jgi:hypothetical protein